MLSPAIVGSQRYVGQLWATSSFNYQGKNSISSARIAAYALVIALDALDTVLDTPNGRQGPCGAPESERGRDLSACH